MCGFRKSVQDFDKTVFKENIAIGKLEMSIQNMKENFCKEVETLKNKQTNRQTLEMKEIIKQIKTITDIIISRQDHAEELISGMEDKNQENTYIRKIIEEHE